MPQISSGVSDNARNNNRRRRGGRHDVHRLWCAGISNFKCQGIGSNLIIVTPGNREEESHGFEQMIGEDKDRKALTVNDVRTIEREQRCNGAAPAILNSSVVKYLNKNQRVTVYASSEKAEFIYNFEVDKGNFYTSSDVLNSANVVLVGQTVINKLFGRIDPMGKIIKIDGKNFTIIGTIKPKALISSAMTRIIQ